MELLIPDMTCGHCKASVTEAVKGVDPAAKIEVDLPNHRARLETSASQPEILAALKEQGYEAKIL